MEINGENMTFCAISQDLFWKHLYSLKVVSLYNPTEVIIVPSKN